MNNWRFNFVFVWKTQNVVRIRTSKPIFVLRDWFFVSDFLESSRGVFFSVRILPRCTVPVSLFCNMWSQTTQMQEQWTQGLVLFLCRVYVAELSRTARVSGSTEQTYQAPHRRFYGKMKRAEKKHHQLRRWWRSQLWYWTVTTRLQLFPTATVQNSKDNQAIDWRSKEATGTCSPPPPLLQRATIHHL